MTHVYILKLNHDKYYVGKTKNIEKRLEQHRSGKGSAWTTQYGVDRLLAVVPGDGWAEEKVTLMMMKQHGVDNVRGGSYSQIKLSQGDRNKSLQQIAAVSDTCYICSSSTHFAVSCSNLPSTLQENTKPSPRQKSSQTQKVSTVRRKPALCGRCGRTGHSEKECYAQTHEDGNALKSRNTRRTPHKCGRCGRTGHSEKECYAQTHEDGNALKSRNTRRTPHKCGRCGRTGHNRTKCYAHTHLNGKDLRADQTEG